MARQDLGKIISEITEINATVDNGVGVPSATATITGTATEKIVNIDFKNLKGDKGDKPENGVDYFTPAEKEQFTAETVKLVTAEGEKQISAVGEKGVTEVGKVTAEGSKQVGLVNAEAVKVTEQLKTLVEGNPETSNALTLSGKSRIEFEKETQGVVGQYDGTFPLTKAEVNKVYLVPQTGKNYICKTAYNGGQISAPNANFEDLSVLENRNRLDNLYKNHLSVTTSNIGEEVHITIKTTGPSTDYYTPFLVIATRDVQGPILAGILCGGNDNNVPHLKGVKILTLVKSEHIKIIDSTVNTPLILKSTFGVIEYNFIKLNDNPRIKLIVETIK